MSHSKIMGGSTAERYINCPGAADLSAPIPDRSSAAAQEGTALHTCMERILEGNHWDATIYLGKTIYGIVITDEHVELLEWCIDRVHDIVQGGVTPYKTEVQGKFPGVEGAFGTADVVVTSPDVIDLIDYKFGRGKVHATSMQMDFYAACVSDDTPVRVHILQPRLNHHDTREISVEEIGAFVQVVQDSIVHRRPEYIEGKWCHFCKASTSCPAKLRKISDALAWRGVDVDMDLVAELEAWCKAARDDALSVLANGGTVSGWKLVEKRPIAKWAVDSTQMTAYFEEAGLLPDDFAPRKLVSPAQAKKLLGSVNDELVVKVSSGVTIAPEADKRTDLGSRDLSNLKLE